MIAPIAVRHDPWGRDNCLLVEAVYRVNDRTSALNLPEQLGFALPHIGEANGRVRIYRRSENSNEYAIVDMRVPDNGAYLILRHDPVRREDVETSVGVVTEVLRTAFNACQ